MPDERDTPPPEESAPPTRQNFWRTSFGFSPRPRTHVLSANGNSVQASAEQPPVRDAPSPRDQQADLPEVSIDEPSRYDRLRGWLRSRLKEPRFDTQSRRTRSYILDVDIDVDDADNHKSRRLLQRMGHLVWGKPHDSTRQNDTGKSSGPVQANPGLGISTDLGILLTRADEEEVARTGLVRTDLAASMSASGPAELDGNQDYAQPIAILPKPPAAESLDIPENLLHPSSSDSSSCHRCSPVGSADLAAHGIAVWDAAPQYLGFGPNPSVPDHQFGLDGANAAMQGCHGEAFWHGSIPLDNYARIRQVHIRGRGGTSWSAQEPSPRAIREAQHERDTIARMAPVRRTYLTHMSLDVDGHESGPEALSEASSQVIESDAESS